MTNGARRVGLPGRRQLGRLIERFGAASTTQQNLTAVLLIAATFALDVLTGPEFAVSIFYLGPVALVAWHRSWASARVAVCLSGAAWLIADVLVRQEYTFALTRYWNASVRTAFFFIVAYELAELRAALNAQHRLARIDDLTGIGNTRSFHEQAAHEIVRQRRYHHPFSVAFIDCDDFKAINDSRGHAAGDEVLRRTARTLARTIREVDFAARLGGDEFAVLLPETDETAAAAVCDKARTALAQNEDGVTHSIGLVTFLEPPPDVQGLLRMADSVMYEVKKAGKNASRQRIIGSAGKETQV